MFEVRKWWPFESILLLYYFILFFFVLYSFDFKWNKFKFKIKK